MMIRAFNDAANADRFLDRYKKRVRYVLGNGWHRWTDKLWAPDEFGTIMQDAIVTARAIKDEADGVGDPDFKQRIEGWASQSQGVARLRAMTEIAATHPDVHLRPDDLDADAFLFNCTNGVIDLKTGQLRRHDPKYLMSKASLVVFDAKAVAPLWHEFLYRIFDGDDAVIEFVCRYLGYALTGDTSARLLLIFWGGGANGKSVLLRVMLHLLGTYGATAETKTFLRTDLKQQDTTVSYDLARLRGARFVAITETEFGQRLNEALLKQLTGGDPVVGRFPFREPFTYVPRFKPLIVTNHRPRIVGGDDAIWDRLALLPFRVRIPEEERDPMLAEKLINEAPGILNWCLSGAQQWIADRKLDPPSSAREATVEYREDSDVLGEFLKARCYINTQARARASELYANYIQWAEENRERHPLSAKAFGARMTERGFVRFTSNGTFYRGIGLLAPEQQQGILEA